MASSFRFLPISRQFWFSFAACFWVELKARILDTEAMYTFWRHLVILAPWSANLAHMKQFPSQLKLSFRMVPAVTQTVTSKWSPGPDVDLKFICLTCCIAMCWKGRYNMFTTELNWTLNLRVLKSFFSERRSEDDLSIDNQDITQAY
jgi:hypothetical protein